VFVGSDATFWRE